MPRSSTAMCESPIAWRFRASSPEESSCRPFHGPLNLLSCHHSKVRTGNGLSIVLAHSPQNSCCSSRESCLGPLSSNLVTRKLSRLSKKGKASGPPCYSQLPLLPTGKQRPEQWVVLDLFCPEAEEGGPPPTASQCKTKDP